MSRPRAKPKVLRHVYSVPEILEWADAHHARTGAWPIYRSGLVLGVLAENWRKVDNALRWGYRGLPGGSSLAQLLAEKRNVRNGAKLPPFRLEQILLWVDNHYKRMGIWPIAESGPIADAPGETWGAVDIALRNGDRGLDAGSSLARLLAQWRGYRNPQGLPPYTGEEILQWADAHHARTGAWPIYRSGPIFGVPGENWRKVHNALFLGYRGLPGGSSLAQFLAERRNVRNSGDLPAFRLKQILLWVDNRHKRTGMWPTAESGTIADAPGETWWAVNVALRNGDRGMKAGSSLARLLAQRRGRRNRQVLPPYTVREILEWADAHHMRTGTWPTYRSGPIAEAPGETWKAVHAALYSGGRGLPGLSSLAQVLAAHRGVTIATQLPPLTLPKMRMWARGHKRLTGSWPTSISGPIAGVPDMTWKKVYEALRVG